MPETPLFNDPRRFPEGWYWALRSRELRPGGVKAVSLLGRELALFRAEDGRVAALDAYCPHMGSHLAEGRVEGGELRCFFHGWRYDAGGRCTDIPCSPGRIPPQARTRSWPVEERYGLLWVWTGPEPRRAVPCPPELEGLELDWALGARFAKNCHPNVVLVNAIDEHHFNTVHRLPVPLTMAERVVDEATIEFSNTTRVPRDTWFARLIGRFYSGALTYSLRYWNAGTGSVTLGPDFLHFHILFALRPVEGGRTEGQTILVTRRRGGLGRLGNAVLLQATRLVGDYFAHGDTKVFQTIRFDLKTPIAADHAILRFMRHTDAQPSVAWGSWERETPAGRRAGEPLEATHG